MIETIYARFTHGLRTSNGGHGLTSSGLRCHSKGAKGAKGANFFTRRDSAPGSAGLPFVVHTTANRARWGC